mmetsp:Transcript_66827/g.118573  ORF Transcript_66827/g.118573 Transcript_66827/m.118573 type:complete len:111 (+) Transcript_66827:430-762(+)
MPLLGQDQKQNPLPAPFGGSLNGSGTASDGDTSHNFMDDEPHYDAHQTTETLDHGLSTASLVRSSSCETWTPARQSLSAVLADKAGDPSCHSGNTINTGTSKTAVWIGST